MRHVDLFSGIGGFALAARWAGLETIAFCEQDSYCQKVLRKHWPDVPIHDDITKLDGTQFKDIFLITGGFPCQDISIAGKGAGLDGERSGLWTELHRIISEVRPRFALIENVPALTFRGGTRVIGDLTEIGYDAEWQIVGADDVGAPHRRKRIWIVAYPHTDTLRCLHRESEEQTNKTRVNALSQPTEICEDVAYPHCDDGRSRSSTKSHHRGARLEHSGSSQRCLVQQTYQDVADSNSTGCQEQWRTISDGEEHSSSECRGRRQFESGLGGALSDGLSTWMDEPDLPRVAKGVPDRVKRLRAIGNSIVPQVAYEIIRAITWTN